MTSPYDFDHYELFDSFMPTSGYDWSVVGIFRRKTDGVLFWATDSGCSCTSEWEDSEDYYDFIPLSTGSVDKLRDAACEFADNVGERDKAHEWVAKWARELEKANFNG